MIRQWAFVALGVCLMPAACSDAPATPSAAAPKQPVAAANQPARPAGSTSIAEREIWEISSIMGSRAGYARTTIRHVTASGRKAVRIEAVDHLDVKRSGERAKPRSRVVSIETPDGRLLRFESAMQLGPSPMRCVGRVVGDRLELETTTRGKNTSASIPWSADCGGPFAAEESLWRRPMQPGQRRTLRTLVPGFNQVATLTLTAKDYESVELPIGTRKLLRIDTLLRFPDGQRLEGSMWMDRRGEVLKSRIAAMRMERVRATRALALGKPETPDLDLLWDLAVKVNRPLPDPHRTERIRYRVQIEDGDPTKAFVSGPSQKIEPTGPHTAELTVYAIRPGRSGGNPKAGDDPPSEDDRQPSHLVQSDNPKIVAMARKAVGDEQDRWRAAVALERYVHRLMTTKDFSQAFATAADVANNPSGDCSEHAVLLAALARAGGIPARAVVGLVYMQGKQSFGYHMWNEVYVEKRWIPLDATVGQGGIGAAHLKLGHSSLKGASAYRSFLPVIQVIGRLNIEILEVK